LQEYPPSAPDGPKLGAVLLLSKPAGACTPATLASSTRRTLVVPYNTDRGFVSQPVSSSNITAWTVGSGSGFMAIDGTLTVTSDVCVYTHSAADRYVYGGTATCGLTARITFTRANTTCAPRNTSKSE
jgi:hypothetical protein